MIRITIQIIVFCVFAINSIFSQVPKNLYLKLEKFENRKLEKAAEDFEEAKQLYAQGVELYKSLPVSDSLMKYDQGYQEQYEKALDNIREGSALYQEAARTFYTIYKEGADKFWNEQEKAGHYALGLEKAKYLESRAKKFIGIARMNRNLVNETYAFEEAIEYLNLANHHEIVAVRDQGRALQIYQDFPIEYDYEWEDDIDIEAILAKKEAERQARNEKLFGAKKPKKDEPIVLPREEDEPEKPYVGEIIYRVQIAAAKMPITDEYIKTIYKGDKQVMEIREDEWYKYQIGKYKHFDDAADELKQTNVKRAFIVVYQDGNRISVQKARKLAP